MSGRPIEILTMLELHTADTFTTRIRKTVEVERSLLNCVQKFKAALGGSGQATSSSSDGEDPAFHSTVTQPEIAQSSVQEQDEQLDNGADWQQPSIEERSQRFGCLLFRTFSARKLLEEKRAREAKAKEEEERQKEMDRRNAGRLMAEAKAKREEQEIAQAAAQRRREKVYLRILYFFQMENEAELARLRAQIKADREEKLERERRGRDAQSGGSWFQSHPVQRYPQRSQRRRNGLVRLRCSRILQELLLASPMVALWN